MLEHVLLRCGLVEDVAELEVFVTDPHAVIGRREACWRVRLRAGAHSQKHCDRLCAGHALSSNSNCAGAVLAHVTTLKYQRTLS